MGTRAPLAVPDRPNEGRSLDFASGALTDGHRYRILAVVGGFTQEWLALVGDMSLSSQRVAWELDTTIAARRRPKAMVSDNGTELTNLANLRWSQDH